MSAPLKALKDEIVQREKEIDDALAGFELDLIATAPEVFASATEALDGDDHSVPVTLAWDKVKDSWALTISCALSPVRWRDAGAEYRHRALDLRQELCEAIGWSAKMYAKSIGVAGK